jgi:hypothetical protein
VEWNIFSPPRPVSGFLGKMFGGNGSASKVLASRFFNVPHIFFDSRPVMILP